MSESWRFVIVTDTHLGQETSAGVHNPVSGDHLAGRFTTFGEALAGCDFVLHVGDVVDHGTREEIAWAAEAMRAWPCPVRICFGNHDARAAGDRDTWLELFPEGFPNSGPERQYSFTHRAVHVVVLQCDWLDPTDVPQPYWADRTCRWRLSDAQLAWLDADLTAPRDLATIVVHHPLSLPLTARLTGTQDLHVPEPDPVAALQAVLERHPQVRLLAGGHAHAHQIEQVGGLCHLATGAISEYPYEYRLVEVADDRWTISTRAWPAADGGMIEPASARTPWVAGQPQDRALLLP